jgi:dienelactone hydrolase
MHVRHGMPHFLDDYARSMRFGLSWADNRFPDFECWKREARAKALECLDYDPPAVDFDVQVLSEEDRGDYRQSKITFAASPWYRVPAYLLTPRGPGPFPAVVACHDHGAFFLYGKEKLVRTAADSNPGLAHFKRTAYGGRSVAEELARRGYVVLCADMLFWGERAARGVGEDELDLATKEGVDAFNRQAYPPAATMASVLFHAGMGWTAVNLRDDMRGAELLASLPEVDAARIGACGLSVGCFRSWHLGAFSERVRATVNVCWMTDIRTQILERCNLVSHYGGLSMAIPGLHRHLDFPDLASLACPKPALFYGGLRDGLFPVHSVEHAYRKMRAVWDSQGAGDLLVTKNWDVPHEFNSEMQEEAFAWLDGILEPRRP